MVGLTLRFHFANASDPRILLSREERIFSLVIRLPLEILRSPGNLPSIAAKILSWFVATLSAPLFVIRHPFFLSPTTSDPYFAFRRSVNVTRTVSTSGYLGYLINPKRSG